MAETLDCSPNLQTIFQKDSRCNSFYPEEKSLASDYSSLHTFALGLTSIMPTKSHVEADFFFINYRKSEFNAAVSDFSLEGFLFARQFNDLGAYLHVIS